MRNQTINQQYQRGVVLFIALVALVVMSIAAAALIRSVDTNTAIAGNLAFRQSALVSASRGAEVAISWLAGKQSANLEADLNASSQVNGYYATHGNLGASLDLDDPAVRRLDTTWDTFGALATGDGISAGIESDSQNKIQYIIERMCEAMGVPGNDPGYLQKCLMGPPVDPGNSGGVVTAEEAGADAEAGESPIYRITVRVTGPKKSQSFTQAYVF